MTEAVRIANNILDELGALVMHGTPVLESARGSLYASKIVPVGCIKLSIPHDEYLEFLQSLPDADVPDPYRLIPMKDRPFDIIVNGSVAVHDGIVFLNGKKVVIL